MARKTPKPQKNQKIGKSFKKIAIAVFGVLLSLFAIHLASKYSVEVKSKHSEDVATVEPAAVTTPIAVPRVERRPKYWFYMARGYMWIFFSVDNVLKKLGLEKIEILVDRHTTIHNDWDLLWSYDYHNELPIDFLKVRYHQKINHIPGNFVLCMKDNLAVNTESKYIAKAFNNTEDLMKYAKENPSARFVQKLWSNRGVELKNISDINFKLFGPGYKYFAQLYIENPLLIDGYKFDFGIYVLVTSIDPLRIYYYGKNTLIRMCEEKYNKSNYDNINSYVISDACMFPWDLEALAVYYNKSYTYKEAMNAYLKKQGHDDVSRIWSQVEDCIRSIVVSKEYNFIFWTKTYAFKHSFFELFRFDFMLDADLNLFLLEVNQSPNINPSEKLYRDRRMFENLLFDTFTLLGIGRYVKRPTFELGDQLEEQMICHQESLTVRPEICVNLPCNESCIETKCEQCWDCLSKNEKHDRHIAYRETKNSGSMKRVFPPRKDEMEQLGSEYLQSLSKANRKQAEWFLEMCKKDSDFC